jgi:hypothetical protein
MLARMAIMATTVINSTRVNPLALVFLIELCGHWVVNTVLFLFKAFN